MYPWKRWLRVKSTSEITHLQSLCTCPPCLRSKHHHPECSVGRSNGQVKVSTSYAPIVTPTNRPNHTSAHISTPSILPPLLADSWWPPHHPCWSQHYWAEPHNTHTVATVLHQTTFPVLSETHRDKSETTKPRQLKHCQRQEVLLENALTTADLGWVFPQHLQVGLEQLIHVDSRFLNQVINLSLIHISEPTRR